MEVVWLKSSRTYGNGACVEVGPTGEHILVRDSKQKVTAPWLSFSAAEWATFADAIKAGHLDKPGGSQ